MHKQSSQPDNNEVINSSLPSMVNELPSSIVHTMIDHMPVSALLVEASGTINFVNKELCETLGYSNKELIGLSVDQLLPEQYRSNHHNLISKFFENPHKRQTGKGQSLYAQHQNGTAIPIEIGLNPIQTDQGIKVLATLLDISERYQASRMFHQAINVSPHGVLIANSQGKITMVNKQLCDYFDYTEEELINQPIEILLPERYRNSHQQVRESFNQEPSIRMMGPGRDLTALHHDGREFPVEIGLSPFEDLNGNSMVMVSMVDITTRKRLMMDLKESNNSLEEFTYVASHDLRSPLRGIADLLEWITEDLGSDVPSDIAHNLNRIAIRVQRMEQLIENLLAYARSGRIDTEVQRINLDNMIDGILEFLQVPDNFNVERFIELDAIVSARTPLETVLRNLVSNAIKHHNKEQGKIVIKCVAENNMCHFSIIDDGPGIPASAIDRIFRLFQTTTSSERKGTGIGLSVSRRLVDVHGGSITLENNSPTAGATFHVRWPRFVRKDTHD